MAIPCQSLIAKPLIRPPGQTIGATEHVWHNKAPVVCHAQYILCPHTITLQGIVRMEVGQVAKVNGSVDRKPNAIAHHIASHCCTRL
jgi:hypothetical protein